MRIAYKGIEFVISLAKEVNLSVPIPFVFRSVIGYHLRKMCCIARDVECASCMFNASCIYGLTFESIVPKDNTVVAGRDRVSHPVIISCDDFIGKGRNTFVLNLIFLGAAISHFPYFFYALKKAGEDGISKERVQYKVSDIVELSNSGGKRSLMTDDEHVITRMEPDIWEYKPETEATAEANFAVTLVSPLRYNVQGKEARRIVAAEFAMCLHRRAQVLCSQYGSSDHAGGYEFSGDWAVTEHNVGWRYFRHYSARQKTAMRIGGMLGSFVLSGMFTAYERALLNFAQLFHGGKSTNFGLGKLKVSEHGRV